MNVKEKRARCVGGVGRVYTAAGQTVNKITVYRAEKQLSAFGAPPGVGHMIENIRELGGREIGING